MTCLYWAYDDLNDLLYIGISENFERRRREHQRTSSWAKLATKWDVNDLPSRSHALVAEAALICLLRPRFNKQHRTAATETGDLIVFAAPWMTTGSGLNALTNLLMRHPGDSTVRMYDGLRRQVPIRDLRVEQNKQFIIELHDLVYGDSHLRKEAG